PREPVILPSMASSPAMTDSTVAARGEALRRLVSAAAWSAPLCNSVTVVVGVPGAGVPPPVGPGVEPGSFQSAMSRSSYRVLPRYRAGHGTAKPGHGASVLGHRQSSWITIEAAPR